MSKEIKSVFCALKEKLEEDADYAWSWHCNIAMPCYDQGVDHKLANKCAAAVMLAIFGIDTSKTEKYNCIMLLDI